MSSLPQETCLKFIKCCDLQALMGVCAEVCKRRPELTTVFTVKIHRPNSDFVVENWFIITAEMVLEEKREAVFF